MLTARRKAILVILVVLFVTSLFSALVLLQKRNKVKNSLPPIVHSFSPQSQEIYAKDNKLIIHGVFRKAHEENENIVLNIEIWDYNSNKYSIETITIPYGYVSNRDDILNLNSDNSFPVVDLNISFNGEASYKDTMSWFSGDNDSRLQAKEVKVVNKVEELKKYIEKDNKYMSNSIKSLMVDIYDIEKPDNTVHKANPVLEYLKIDRSKKKSLREETFPFLRKALNLEEQYVLPENSWKKIVEETTWDWKSKTNLKSYIDTKLFDIDSSRGVWNDEEIHYKGTEQLGHIRRVSEYLWFASSYYLENSFDCNKAENVEVCNELVELYTFNKSYLSTYYLRGGYGICSAAYMLPELVKLTNNQDLQNDLELLKENKEKLYRSCTFSGGGNGLCARDLKESVNCGLLLANSNDMELTKQFVLDRYTFFDKLEYERMQINLFSSKNALYSEMDVVDSDFGMYLVRHMDDVKFLRILNYCE